MLLFFPYKQRQSFLDRRKLQSNSKQTRNSKMKSWNIWQAELELCSVGINELDGLINLNYSVYPNPSFERIYFSFDLETPREINVVIVDMMGRTVKRRNFKGYSGENVESISINNLAKGTYLFKIQIDSYVQTSKLIKL